MIIEYQTNSNLIMHALSNDNTTANPTFNWLPLTSMDRQFLKTAEKFDLIISFIYLLNKKILNHLKYFSFFFF
jgi:hypothetical protein